MCIWNVKKKDRLCMYCSYRKGCERYPGPNEKRVVPEEEFQRYYNAMYDVIGEDMITPSRAAELVWARNLMMYQMHVDGYGPSAIGRVMKKNHSTVTHSVSIVNTMLEFPSMYPLETSTWRRFQERLSSQKQ